MMDEVHISPKRTSPHKFLATGLNSDTVIIGEWPWCAESSPTDITTTANVASDATTPTAASSDSSITTTNATGSREVPTNTTDGGISSGDGTPKDSTTSVTMNDDDFTGKNIFIIIVVIATIFMASLTIVSACCCWKYKKKILPFLNTKKDYSFDAEKGRMHCCVQCPATGVQSLPSSHAPVHQD